MPPATVPGPGTPASYAFGHADRNDPVGIYSNTTLRPPFVNTAWGSDRNRAGQGRSTASFPVMGKAASMETRMVGTSLGLIQSHSGVMKRSPQQTLRLDAHDGSQPSRG
jgi:hypothetical protein